MACQGRPTTDPAAALDGVMLPMGGPKGSALAIMMDVFSGVLSGSAFAVSPEMFALSRQLDSCFARCRVM